MFFAAENLFDNLEFAEKGEWFGESLQCVHQPDDRENRDGDIKERQKDPADDRNDPENHTTGDTDDQKKESLIGMVPAKR